MYCSNYCLSNLLIKISNKNIINIKLNFIMIQIFISPSPISISPKSPSAIPAAFKIIPS